MNCTLHTELVDRALRAPTDWIDLAQRPGETLDDPERVWRGCVLPCEMPLERPNAQGPSEAYTETFQAIVVRSSELQHTHAQAAQQRRERAQRQSHGPIKRLSAQTCACAQDAEAAAQRFVREHLVPGLVQQAHENHGALVNSLRNGRREGEGVEGG